MREVILLCGLRIVLIKSGLNPATPVGFGDDCLAHGGFRFGCHCARVYRSDSAGAGGVETRSAGRKQGGRLENVKNVKEGG